MADCGNDQTNKFVCGSLAGIIFSKLVLSKSSIMKKLSFLLAALFAFSQMHAQSREEVRRLILGTPKTVVVQNSPRLYKSTTRYNKHNKNYGGRANPGKHLGWYKGVGNPHRYGGKAFKRKGRR